MIATYTNLARPTDPFRTGQQMFSKPGPMLTAFTLTTDLTTGDAGRVSIVVASMVYLGLHRTRTVMVDSHAVPAGFHAVSASDHRELRALVSG